MPDMAIGAALTGASALFGGLSNRSKKNTQSSTSTPTYTNTQSMMQEQLAQILGAGAMDPSAGTEPLKTGAIEGVNRNYSGLQKRMESKLADRGFGSSGKVATGTRQLETARAGDLGGLESKFAALTLDQKNKYLDLMSRFSFANPGSKQTGEQITPGNVAAGALGAGLETFSYLSGY